MIKKAAAVILHKGTGKNLRVFLAERSPKLRFLGGYYAFPGGVVDGDSQDAVGALRECARRELFEETGVLLGAPSDLDAARRKTVREALLRHEQQEPGEREAGTCAEWDELCARCDRALFTEVCGVLTPPFAPIRYDTVFYLAALPAGETAEIWPGELVRGEWVKPAEALERWRRGELKIAPPVLTLLEVLENVGLAAFPQIAAGLMQGFKDGILPPVRFSPGVMMASLRSDTIPPADTTNTYIVGNEIIWVIDPGTSDEEEQARLLDLLDNLVDAGRTLGGILLTHHHPDHIAGLVAVATELDLEVRAHPRTLDRLPEGVRLGAALEDGDTVELGSTPDGAEGWRLHAIFTPGHAQGHLCFREDRYFAVIAGDMISTLSTIVIDPPEGHLTTYMQSLHRLEALEIGTLYPAHGPPAQDGRRVIKRFLTHREARQAKLVAAVTEGPGDPDSLLSRVYDDVAPAILPIARRSLEAGLEKLQEDGIAACKNGAWEIVRG